MNGIDSFERRFGSLLIGATRESARNEVWVTSQRHE
jgi:hypothetical protein